MRQGRRGGGGPGQGCERSYAPAEAGGSRGAENDLPSCGRTSPGPSAATIAQIAILALIVGCLTVWTVKRNAVYEDMVTFWRSVVESTPDKRRSHHNYAVALSAAGNRSSDGRWSWEALRELRTVLVLPDDGSVNVRDVYGAIGITYYQLDLVEDAIIAWKEGLTRFPNDANLESYVASAMVRVGRYDEARVHALAAMQADPTVSEVANTLGLICLEKGEYQKAAEHFVRFQELRPEVAMGYWNAAVAFEKAGNYPRAYEMAMLFLAREPDPNLRAKAQFFVETMRFRQQTLSK
jgi:tetratricopeptide (TPR) repeat protein